MKNVFCSSDGGQWVTIFELNLGLLMNWNRVDLVRGEVNEQKWALMMGSDNNWTNIQVRFWHCHVRDTIVILE